MKVQVINTPKGKRYVLLDDQYKPIDVVNKYLKFLDNLGKSPNTQRTYAYDLLLYCQFMQKKEISLLDLCNNRSITGAPGSTVPLAWNGWIG